VLDDQSTLLNPEAPLYLDTTTVEVELESHINTIFEEQVPLNTLSEAEPTLLVTSPCFDVDEEDVRDIAPNERDLNLPSSGRVMESSDDVGSPVSNKMTSWSCSFLGCSSRVLFTRHCDPKKHYQRHINRFFCRFEECPSSESIISFDKFGRKKTSPGKGFSSKKDRLRHEMRHDPKVRCEECGKKFSRTDNMKDHKRRIHGNEPLRSSPAED
jgi:hypothetical protein